MSPPRLRRSQRQALRVFLDSPPEQRVVACLKVMAQAMADKDLVMLVFFRHLMALAIAEFRRQKGAAA